MSSEVSSVFLCIQANAESVPKIASCYCMLLAQTSRFKFIKINPLALNYKIINFPNDVL
jgi:hypothetical protein